MDNPEFPAADAVTQEIPIPWSTKVPRERAWVWFTAGVATGLLTSIGLAVVVLVLVAVGVLG